MSDEKPIRTTNWLKHIFHCGNRDTIDEAYLVAQREQYRRSKEIDKQLSKYKDHDDSIHKVLLLGGPGSGKSTIFKQMKILHKAGFTNTDYVNFRYLIHANTMEAMHQLIEGGMNLEIPFESDAVTIMAESYEKSYNPCISELSEKTTQLIKSLYDTIFIQKVLERKDEIELLDSALYFLNNIDRIATPDYRPSIDDILRSRVATAGITEMQFNHRDHILRMVDVGGQRNEQRKWIHCFDNVSGILFVAELSSYNIRMLEGDFFDHRVYTFHNDRENNKLRYTMRMFKGIVNNPIFISNTAMILFLNKVDIYKDKLTRQNINVCFKDYKGDNSFENTSAYIQKRFEHQVAREIMIVRPLYVHFTNATDTKNIDRVFDSCLDIVFKRNMERVGLGN